MSAFDERLAKATRAVVRRALFEEDERRGFDPTMVAPTPDDELVDLRCADCGAGLSIPSAELSEAVLAFAREGWTVRDGKVLCPVHAERAS